VGQASRACRNGDCKLEIVKWKLKILIGATLHFSIYNFHFSISRIQAGARYLPHSNGSFNAKRRDLLENA